MKVKTQKAGRWTEADVMAGPHWVSLVALLSGLTVASGCGSAPEQDGATKVVSSLSADPTLTLLGSYKNTGGATEISAYDPASMRLFSVNSTSVPSTKVDVIDISNPAAAVSAGEIPTDSGTPNSVAVHDGLLAIAWEAAARQEPGKITFHDAATLALLGTVPVGSEPDDLRFTKRGDKLLVANEGEPSNNYASDPEGSVTIIEIRRKQGPQGPYTFEGSTVSFTPGTPMVNPESIRIFGGGGTFGGVTSLPSTAAQDFEPEYIAVSDDGKTAWVTLQENNAIAVLDIRKKMFTKIVGLGFKDHSLPGNGLDVSDRDGLLGNIQNWPIRGMYQPDAINQFKWHGEEFLVMANEGDAREWGSFTEESRVAALVPLKDAAGAYVRTPGRTELRIDHPAVLDGSAASSAKLGRLTVTTKGVPLTENGALQDIYSFGARSFAVRDKNGNVVFESGDQIEQLMSTLYPGFQNSDQQAAPAPDSRSDNKGPEPEGIAVSKINGTTYAFIGLERMGGVLMYDLKNPAAPRLVTYVNNRSFTTPATPGDLGPEGLLVISANDSPSGEPILVISNEISGTASFYQIDGCGHGDDDAN